jgi:hypothetical protein
MSIIKFNSKNLNIKKYIKDFQKAFNILLSDTNEGKLL